MSFKSVPGCSGGLVPVFGGVALSVNADTYDIWNASAANTSGPTTITLSANSGDVQIELLQQKCKTPSMYLDFLAAGREGVQHWSSWPENYREIYDRARSAGYEVGQEGTSNRGPFVYFLKEGHPGTVIEMAEMTPARRRSFDIIRDAARGWDGSNAIRPMPV